MARPLRVQYEGARYHVINRGNYRTDVFGTVGAAQSFETTMEETCDRYGWRLFAHVIMRNHYHLAIETPLPNLIDGMHWLQGTFATRFNRFRSERGHLFQGRYHALLIEDAAALARVVTYIHLNPVRAGMVPGAQASDFRWSSLHRFVRGPRPNHLYATPWLHSFGFKDERTGWAAYTQYLTAIATDPESPEMEPGQLSRGWAIGTHGWRRAIAQANAHRALSPGISSEEAFELKAVRWRAELEAALHDANRAAADAANGRQSAEWKVEAAIRLRSAGAPCKWIADALQMGSAANVRVYLARARR